MKISYSFGMVDLMHYGHMIALKRAAEGADLKIFGLVGDEASNAWVGKIVSNQQEREEVLHGVKYIDTVMHQETFDPIDNLKIIHKKYPEAEITLFHGSDWKVIPAQKYIESIGGKAVTLDYYERLSPMRIIESLTKEDENLNHSFTNLISTKANTLLLLKDKLLKSKIEELYIFTVEMYNNASETVIREIQKHFPNSKIVIRSSSEREDAFETSNAGHFDSVLGVNAGDANAIRRAIEKVVASYGEIEKENNEQILVQSQTEGVQVAGVVFTRDIQRNRPYYVINYDDNGSTDSVTSGNGGKTAWMIHSIETDSIPGKWTALIEAVREIENFFSGMLLDIEFAITNKDIVIFQVRPLAAAYKFGRRVGNDDFKKIRESAKIKYGKGEEKGLTCYSDMAFWNPAEIIGDNPKNLDYSLYRHIITKKAWDEGITALGYRKVDRELMYRFGNKPYINLEYAFEALIPAAISEELTNKLLEFYLKKLKSDLSAHDKIEFEIAVNCFDFSTYDQLKRLEENGFSEAEILELEQALRRLTEKLICNYSTILKHDMDDIRALEGIRLDIQNITKDCSDFQFIARSVHSLLDAVSKYGTPQFSRQARCAFIAKSLCKSLFDKGYISSEAYNGFMYSIETVASDYEKDYRAFQKGKIQREEFWAKYGHLRAGTYNIRSPRYDQMRQVFALEQGNIETEIKDDKQSFLSSDETERSVIAAVEKAVMDIGLNNITTNDILFFMRKAIEEREYFKFVFTKSLSFAMELIKRLGDMTGVDVRKLSYLELPEIFSAEYYSTEEKLREFWDLIIEKRHKLYKINSELILPSVICSLQDFDYIENLESRPNYITEKKVSAEIVVLTDENSFSKLEGKIVIIEKADPGYDWIFSKGIVGLITKYGGAASHMAIRCAEFGIPAAIGCGGRIFDYAANSKKVTLDCKHENLVRISDTL